DRRMRSVAAICVVCLAVAAVPALAQPRASTAGACIRERGSILCLNVLTRKRIFYALVHYQDTHPGRDTAAYFVIAKRWNITINSARKIAVEGAMHLWPPMK